MLIRISQIISIITVFQLLLFSVFLFSVKRKKPSHHILITFLIVNALFILNFLIPNLQQFFNISLIHFRYIGFSFGFLFGPTLFFFTKSLIYKEFKFNNKDAIHLIPFIIYSVIMIFAFHIHSEEVKTEMLKNHNVMPPIVWNIIIPFFHLLILYYMVASIRLISFYGNELKKVHSSIETINLSWLQLILYAFILMWIIDVSHFILGRLIEMPGILSSIMTFVSLTINFVFALILVLKALKHPELFFEIEQKQEKIKYGKSQLTKEESEVYLKKLLSYMKTEKPFLTPSLTIGMIAEKISVSSKILSQVINENLHQNFFDFVNSYRIEEAKEILTEPGNKKTILEILYEVGFNSKSVFNTAFKNHTGITPTQYKRQLQKAILSNKVA